MTRPHAYALPSRRDVSPTSPPTLTQFVVLSLLLHALLVVVFGTPAGGGGAAGWRNPLSVTLRSRVPDTDALVRASPGEARGRVGPAFPRSEPQAPPAPPSTTARSRAPSPAAPPEASRDAQPPPTAVPEAAAPAEDVLPRLNPGAPVEVDKPVVPDVQIIPQHTKPKPAPAPAPAARARRKEVARPAPPVDAPRPELPIGDVPPQDLPAARALETAPPHPVEPPAATVLQGDAPQRVEREAAPAESMPLTPPEPKPVPPPEPMPQLPPRPRIDLTPELVPLPAPTREPIPQLDDTPALRAMTDLPQKRETPAPAPAPVMPAPPVIVPTPATPSESASVRDVPPTPAAPAPVAEPVTPATARDIASPATAPAAPDGRSADSPSAREATPSSGPARLNFGAQPAIDDDLRQLVEPPSATLAAPGTRPRLSFERPLAPRGIGSGSGLVQLNIAPPAPEPESKLARAIQKAAKPDCRDAYAGLGLLAVPVLIADAIVDKGCRW